MLRDMFGISFISIKLEESFGEKIECPYHTEDSQEVLNRDKIMREGIK